MNRNKSKIFPVIITVLIIGIMVYLFANLEQPYVECSRSSTNDLGILVKEQLVAQLGSNKIGKMEVTKTVVLPEQYLNQSDSYLDSIRFTLEKAYEYLGKDKVTFTKESDRLIVHIEISRDETIILNNLEFTDVDGLQIQVNSNTKSSDVVTLSIKDKYTEGELMTRMKNNGYLCK